MPTQESSRSLLPCAQPPYAPLGPAEPFPVHLKLREKRQPAMGGAGSKPPATAPPAPQPAPEFGLDVGENLESSLRKLIPLVHAGDTKAQQQAASCLANLAVQDEHQVTIVKQGGLLLLIPLMAKGDVEVQRLAAHAVANLAVNGPAETSYHRCYCGCFALSRLRVAALAADNRQNIVAEGGIRPLVALMRSPNLEVQRQSTKAIANLAVNGTRDLVPQRESRADTTKLSPAVACVLCSGEQDQDRGGGCPARYAARDYPQAYYPAGSSVLGAVLCHTYCARVVSATAILDLARDSAETVRCEAIAALANLAVNGVRGLRCSLLL